MIDVYRQGVPGNGNPFPKTLRFVKLACSSKRPPEPSYFVMVADTRATSRTRCLLSLGHERNRSLRSQDPLINVAYWALFGHGAMSDLSPLSGVKRKLDFGAVRAAFDPNADFLSVMKRTSDRAVMAVTCAHYSRQ